MLFLPPDLDWGSVSCHESKTEVSLASLGVEISVIFQSDRPQDGKVLGRRHTPYVVVYLNAGGNPQLAQVSQPPGQMGWSETNYFLSLRLPIHGVVKRYGQDRPANLQIHFLFFQPEYSS